MLRSFSRSPARWSIVLLGWTSLACSDAAQCIDSPCPTPLAANITVTSSSAPLGIPGLTLVATGPHNQTQSCTIAAESKCTLLGGAGFYHVQVSAPGYVTASFNVSINSLKRGDCGCEEPFVQELSVLMAKAS